MQINSKSSIQYHHNTMISGVGLAVRVPCAPSHPVVGVAGRLAAAVGEPLLHVAAVQGVSVAPSDGGLM